MKKYIIFLFIFIISCAGDSENSNVILEIEPDTNEGETSESKKSTDDNVLEYPADFDIERLFECLSDNGINPIPSPEFTRAMSVAMAKGMYAMDILSYTDY